nr:IST1-like protein [Ipomoea batatas]
MAKMTVARIKLLRNKREVVVRQMRRDIAMLLETGQDATARIRVEHVIREQNVLAANEFIELFCELIVARLPIIAKQRECPADLKEGISSLIFAGPRCSEIPELLEIRDVFEKKYGKDFVSAATDLRPNAGVNRMLIEKLSVKTPSGEVKLKIMKEIAKEYQVEWDTTESEVELLKAPEERIEGPNTFVSATSLPVKPVSRQSIDPNNPTTIASSGSYGHVNDEQYDIQRMNRRNSGDSQHSAGRVMPIDDIHAQKILRRHSYNANSDVKYDESDCDEEIEMESPTNAGRYPPSQPTDHDSRQIYRRHSYNTAPSQHSGVNFEESYYAQPPERPAPQVPRVHPKLPDYDELTSRFEALKYQK